MARQHNHHHKRQHARGYLHRQQHPQRQLPFQHNAQRITNPQRRQREIKGQPQTQDVLAITGTKNRFNHHEVTQNGVDNLHQQETKRDADCARHLPTNNNRRNKQKCFEYVEFKADIDPRFRHQQRTNRVTYGAQQTHHTQQLQHRNNAVPLFTKDQRYKVIRHHHQPQQSRKVDNPHYRQQLVEVNAQLFGVVLNFGECRKQHTGDDRVQLHRWHNGHVVRQVVSPCHARAENTRQHER